MESFILRFVPRKYRMRLGDVKIDLQGLHPDTVLLKEPASIASGIEVSREAYLNFLQIYVSANVMLVGL